MKQRNPDLTLVAVAVALAALLAAGCRAAPATAGPDPAGPGPGAEGAAGAVAAGDEIAHYTCSMHPSVRNAEPGACPICSMYLVAVSRRDLESGEVVLDPGRRQQIGVTTAHVELRPLHASVRAVGEVTYDQSRLTDVTLRVGGWIDQLHADRLGQRVEEGETLFTLYSPDLFEAQQAYLDAVEKLTNARKVRSPLSSDLALETRRRRLRLADLGPDQLESLDDRGLPLELVPILAPASGYVIEKNLVAGAAVAPAMRLLRIAGLDRVWVEAEVYESELGLLEVGDAATVTLPHLPGKSFSGRVSFVYPWLDGSTRTGRVRIELPNPGLVLKPQMYAEVVFEPDLGERLAVPEEAILYAGDQRYVFVDLGDGRLRPQVVTLGRRAGDWVEVLDGLEAGDVAVTSGNFLIAAEARLKLAIDHWAPATAAVESAAHGAHGADGDHGAHAAHGGDDAHVAHAGEDAHVAHAGDDAHAAHAGEDAHAAQAVGGAHAAHAGDGAHAAHAVDGHDAAAAGEGGPAADAAGGANAASGGHAAHPAPPVAVDHSAHPAHGDHAAPAADGDQSGHTGHAGHGDHAAQPEPPR